MKLSRALLVMTLLTGAVITVFLCLPGDEAATKGGGESKRPVEEGTTGAEGARGVGERTGENEKAVPEAAPQKAEKRATVTAETGQAGFPRLITARQRTKRSAQNICSVANAALAAGATLDFSSPEKVVSQLAHGVKGSGQFAGTRFQVTGTDPADVPEIAAMLQCSEGRIALLPE